MGEWDKKPIRISASTPCIACMTRLGDLGLTASTDPIGPTAPMASVWHTIESTLSHVSGYLLLCTPLISRRATGWS